ncbi:MAG TPA: hypothetical protein GX507_06190 [Clostridia bacterium]|nr:hypothetical protein [Clostridia bacterium]
MVKASPAVIAVIMDSCRIIAGELECWPYPGHFLNDLYFACAKLVA